MTAPGKYMLDQMKRIALLCFVLMSSCAGTASAATSLWIKVNRPDVPYGAKVRLSGSAAPAGTAERLVIQQRSAGGDWRGLRIVETDAATGRWSLTTSPEHTTSYRARSGKTTVSAPVRVAVAPVIRLRVTGAARPFLGVPVSLRVVPSSYRGKVTLSSRSASGEAVRQVRVRHGEGNGMAPVNKVGRVRITGRSRESGKFASGSAEVTVKARGRTFRRGDRGPDVRALMRHLRSFGFLTPRSGRRYSFAASEVTMAFHKVYGMPRSYVWSQRSWRRLSRLAHGPQPRYPGKRTHVEVSKGRQFMMIARNGRPISIIHVSTGRTGNTPLGNFRIVNRRPDHLPYFEGFIGNFGLHGYYQVPPYPASHGCVREPMWAAKFTWRNTGIGTPVHIYW